MRYLRAVPPGAIPERDDVEKSDNLGQHTTIHVEDAAFSLWFVSRDGNVAVFCHRNDQQVIDTVLVLFFGAGRIVEADLLIMQPADGWMTGPRQTGNLVHHVQRCIAASGHHLPAAA